MSIKKAEMSQADVDWYNAYYKVEQKNFTPWYALMLDFLKKEIEPKNSILEVGCGQSKGLRWLNEKKLIAEENIFAIDQSDEAVFFSKKHLPRANIVKGDVYHLGHGNNKFDYVLLMEVIEHLQNPEAALAELHKVLKPGGVLILSFPNYFNLPWLLVRILAEKLNRPNWIVLQPVDKIYNTIKIINLCKRSHFSYKKIIGSGYFPPLFYKYEKSAVTKFFNAFNLGHLSFHPILIFEKIDMDVSNKRR